MLFRCTVVVVHFSVLVFVSCCCCRCGGVSVHCGDLWFVVGVVVNGCCERVLCMFVGCCC